MENIDFANIINLPRKARTAAQRLPMLHRSGAVKDRKQLRVMTKAEFDGCFL